MTFKRLLIQSYEGERAGGEHEFKPIRLDSDTYMLHTVGEYRARFYRDEKGRSGVLDYYRGMPKKHRAKAAKWIKLLESEGPNLPRPYADVIESPVRELRPKIAGLQHRFLYVIHEKTILFTNGFLKKSDKVPRNEIEKAKSRYAGWLKRR